ncbi:MAG TPA: hypothetical protein VEX38_00560, partial [Fimbriimonadaceae bacterium]|nr:hypothetical protein [Fimbriimonadaceae bacterium]
CLWTMVGACAACADPESRTWLSLALAPAGLVFAAIRFLGSLKALGSTPALAALDYSVSLTGTLLGFWFLSIMAVRHQWCVPCLVFWACHYASVCADTPRAPRLTRLFWIATLSSMAALAAARMDKVAWSNFQALSLTYLPAAMADTEWIRPGQSIPQDIRLGAKTALVVWTACKPCGRIAAQTGLRNFSQKYPGFKSWVMRGTETSLPPELQKNYLIAPPDFFTDLGIQRDDPPAYILLEGHRVVTIGQLKDYR